MTQNHTVRQHLIRHGYVTRIIAMSVYHIGDLRKVISRLRAEGMKIESVKKTDDFGRIYTRYTLVEQASNARAA